MAIRKVLSPIGSEVIVVSSSRRTSERRMASQSGATLTCSRTHSQSRCFFAGVPIDQVSLLLGHASVKITEKSYSPFVKARVVQLQESVGNAWKAGYGNGPQNTPPPTPSMNKHTGWQVIQSGKKAKVSA